MGVMGPQRGGGGASAKFVFPASQIYLVLPDVASSYCQCVFCAMGTKHGTLGSGLAPDAPHDVGMTWGCSACRFVLRLTFIDGTYRVLRPFAMAACSR